MNEERLFCWANVLKRKRKGNPGGNRKHDNMEKSFLPHSV